MSKIPYGNKGPDLRLRFTRRLCHELSQLVTGYYHVNANALGIDISTYDALRAFIYTARSVETGYTVNLGTHERELLIAIRICLKAVERYCTHAQVKKAARERGHAFDEYLGLSAVDRLADVVQVKA